MKHHSAALLFMLLAGCSSLPATHTTPADPSQFSGQAVDQVVRQFGQPQAVDRLDAFEVYEYRNLAAPGSGTHIYSFLVEQGRVIESTPGTLKLYREDGITKVRAQML